MADDNTRKIVKRRIGEDGRDIECEEDADLFVDLKDDKKTTYKRGRGFHFRKLIFTYKPDMDDGTTTRKYEPDPLEIELLNDGDGVASPIPYSHGVIKSYQVSTGRGRHYQKTRIHYLNTEENTSRKIRVQRVESTDNPDTYVDVERVKSFKNKKGRGFVFRAKVVNRKHEEEDIEAMDGPCKIESEQ